MCRKQALDDTRLTLRGGELLMKTMWCVKKMKQGWAQWKVPLISFSYVWCVAFSTCTIWLKGEFGTWSLSSTQNERPCEPPNGACFRFFNVAGALIMIQPTCQQALFSWNLAETPQQIPSCNLDDHIPNLREFYPRFTPLLLRWPAL